MRFTDKMMSAQTQKYKVTAGTPIHAPHGTSLSCRGWHQEAALRMLMNNLNPDVAEKPDELIVYGGTGKAARNWDCYRAIVQTLKRLENDETLLVQSGKPVGVFPTHEEAPRVLIANSNLVPRWGNWDVFRDLEAKGLTMYGQMTAGSWIYIGSQGIVQGTYETFVEVGRLRYVRRWPLGGSEADAIDLVGVAEDGRPVVAAARQRLGLEAVGHILDGALALETALPILLEGAEAPVQLTTMSTWRRWSIASSQWMALPPMASARSTARSSPAGLEETSSKARVCSASPARIPTASP